MEGLIQAKVDGASTFGASRLRLLDRELTPTTDNFLEEIFGHHASLLSGTKDFCLFDDDVGILSKTVTVAARARCDPLGDNRVTSFANLIKLRFRGYLCRFRCSFAQRHSLFSSDFVELHSDFWPVAKIASFASETKRLRWSHPSS